MLYCIVLYYVIFHSILFYTILFYYTILYYILLPLFYSIHLNLFQSFYFLSLSSRIFHFKFLAPSLILFYSILINSHHFKVSLICTLPQPRLLFRSLRNYKSLSKDLLRIPKEMKKR